MGESFGELLRRSRLASRLTQELLAELASISARSVRALERDGGRGPQPHTVERLATALGLRGQEREAFVQAGRKVYWASRAGRPRVDDSAQSRDEAAPAGVQVPIQLPADLAVFTGRAEQLRMLDNLVGAGRGRAPAAVVVAAIVGAAGVGKTALAVHWAHRARHRFPDGQLYVNLRGFDPSGKPLSTTEAVRSFLDAFGVPAQRIPSSPDGQFALYRTVLSGRRVLVLLDNARDSDQVRSLLPGTAGCVVLVTSRNPLLALVAADGAHPLNVGVLTFDHARRLLTRRLGTARLAAEPPAVAEIVARCAGLPLALAIVAARVATSPGLSLQVLADDLRRTSDNLDAFSGPDPAADIRAVFSYSYAAVGDQAAHLFRLLSLHVGPDLSVAAAASVAGVPVDRVRPLLAELVQAHLIIELRPGRYGFHDLLRKYALELSRQDAGEELRSALDRLLDHYVQSAWVGDRVINPSRDPITLDPPGSGVTVTEIDGHDEALSWFSAECSGLLAAVEQANRASAHRFAQQLSWSLATFLSRQGRWAELIDSQRIALRSAEHVSDRGGQAIAHRILARAYAFTGRQDDALSHFRSALAEHAALGDRGGQASVHLGIAWIFEQSGRHPQALTEAQAALRLFRAAGHRTGELMALGTVGWYHVLLGDYDTAIGLCGQALRAGQAAGDLLVQAANWDSIGHARHHLHDTDQAVTCYRQALRLYGQIGDRYNQADVLGHLGDTYHASGNLAAAHDHWEQALRILEEFEDPKGDELRAKLAGTAPAAHRGDIDEQ